MGKPKILSNFLKTESDLLCKSKETSNKSLSISRVFAYSKKTKEEPEKRSSLRHTDDMNRGEKRTTLESTRKEEMTPKIISSEVMAETCEQRMSFFRKPKTVAETPEKKSFASMEENEEIPKKRTSLLGHSENKDDFIKKRLSLKSWKETKGTTEIERDSSDRSANGKNISRTWKISQHDEIKTMAGKEINVLLKTKVSEPAIRKLLTRSHVEEENNEKGSNYHRTSKAIEEVADRKRCSFSLSKRDSKEDSNACPRRHSWDPKMYIRRVRAFLKLTFKIIFISIISCWHRIHTTLKSTEARLLLGIKTSLYFMIEVTPKEIVKYFMVYSCHVLPDLRHRSAVLYVLNSAPARLTKKIASTYLRKVPVCLMSWHAHLLLRASPIRKIATNLVQILRLPRKLLETVFMSAASVLKILSRAMTFSRYRKTELTRRQSLLSLWKLRIRTASISSDQVLEKKVSVN